jgi:hypothetical protein
MELWFVFLLLALFLGIFGLLCGRRGRPNPPAGQEACGLSRGPDFNLEILPRGAPSVQAPDVFNEDRVRCELAAFAETPGILTQFVGRARSGITKAGERAIVRDWTGFFEEAQALIGAKTEMERKRSEFLQLANEHEVRAKEKEVAIARHDAEIAEEALRRETAEYKRQRLDQFVEGGQRPEPEPKLTPSQQRLLKRAELEQDLQRLKTDEAEAIQKAETDADKRRIQNMYSGRRSQLTDLLERSL